MKKEEIKNCENKILEINDEFSNGDLKNIWINVICGRITYDDYPIINYLCTQECKELYKLLDKMEVIEVSHELHVLRDKKRQSQKDELQNKIRIDYELGNYEVSEFSQHMANKYKD